jgi:hypothetical protein
MARTVITADEAAALAKAEAEAKTETESEPTPPPARPKTDEPATVTFRTSNIGRIFLPDGTPFDFMKPMMTVSDPRLISALTELSKRTPTNISIHQPQ